MNVLCVIPARGGSTRIPRKNLQEIDGISLVEMAHLVARRTPDIARIVVSTDSQQIADRFPRDHVVERPANISGPTADIAATIRHALLDTESRDRCAYDVIVTLQPTVPVRTPSVIHRMLQAMEIRCALSAITGVRVVPWLWSAIGSAAMNGWSPDSYPRSQDIKPIYWQEINAVQIARRSVVLSGERWSLPLLVHFLPPYATLDIDDEADLERARTALGPILEAMGKDDGDGSIIVENINADKATARHLVHG